MRKTVTLLREAADRLRAAGDRDLVIPDYEEEERYALGLQPGTYRLAEVAEVVLFLADMLEE